MEINGKDFMKWLHELRRKMWDEEKRVKMVGTDWIRKTRIEAEKILGHKIPKMSKVYHKGGK